MVISQLRIGSSVRFSRTSDPAVADAQQAWVNKFIKRKWGDNGHPPLDKRFLNNRPDLNHVEKMWGHVAA